MEESERKGMEKEIDRLRRENKLLRSRIIEQSRLEEQFLRVQKMEALASLTGGIAHDFNNILQTILGYTQFACMRNTDNDPNYEIFLEIEKALAKGSALTRQLLALGRKIEARFTPLDLNGKIKEIKELLERTIPKMVKIELKLTDDLKMLNADHGAIEQVLMNLSINAKDAMSNGGKLTFETENIIHGWNHPDVQMHKQDEEFVLLKVSDTGCGMSPGVRKCIFEPFFTTKENGKGTGLGLSMVDAIVKGHKGFIECESEMGQGTSFKMYFPSCDSANQEPVEMDLKPERRYSGGDEAIMLVDDEEGILKIGKEMLEKHGYKVIEARTGEEAIRKYPHEAVDLVVLDVGMPGMGGIGCLQELLSINPKVKVLIISGYSLNGRVKTALELGGKDFLAKPYPLTKLLEKVRSLLDEPVE